MIWNRCPTAMRFQNYLPCVVCYWQRTRDAIEHDVYCNRARRIASEVLRHYKMSRALPQAEKRIFFLLGNGL
eukprot:4178880-Alexandrium_andersonii.AAC.1